MPEIRLRRNALRFSALRAAQGTLSRDVERDIRYYVDTWVCCALTKKAQPTVADIVGILQACVNRIPPEVLKDASDAVFSIYQKLGGTDAVSKSPDFRIELLSAITDKFNAAPPPNA